MEQSSRGPGLRRPPQMWATYGVLTAGQRQTDRHISPAIQLVSLAYCHQRLHFKCVHINVPAEDQNCNTIARTATEGMWSQWKKIMVFVTQCRLLHCTYVPDPPRKSVHHDK